MRLIDMDELIESAERQCDLGCKYPKNYKDAMCRACPVGYVKDMIEDAPTVDAEPVRHLCRSDVYEPFYQWLGQPSASEKWIALRSLIDDLVERCGAKMDKEDRNEQ